MNRQALVTMALLALLATNSSPAAEPVVTSTMVGAWEGTAHIIVNWCQQTNLPVRVEVRSNGDVSVQIGDAVLSKGHLRKNRGWLGRKLNVKTDYIIEGRLTGTLLAGESISRSAVKIPLNFTGTSFVGGLHTSGCKLGAEGCGIVSARLTLQRTGG